MRRAKGDCAPRSNCILSCESASALRVFETKVRRRWPASNGAGDGSEHAGQVDLAKPEHSDTETSHAATPDSAFTKKADELWRRAEAGRDSEEGLPSS